MVDGCRGGVVMTIGGEVGRGRGAMKKVLVRGETEVGHPVGHPFSRFPTRRWRASSLALVGLCWPQTLCCLDSFPALDCRLGADPDTVRATSRGTPWGRAGAAAGASSPIRRRTWRAHGVGNPSRHAVLALQMLVWRLRRLRRGVPDDDVALPRAGAKADSPPPTPAPCRCFVLSQGLALRPLRGVTEGVPVRVSESSWRRSGP
jgi:hypothetical protein